MFLGSRGFNVLSFILAVYLYGDLSIFASATPSTLVTIFPGNMKEITIPWISSKPFPLSIDVAYYLWLFLFAVIVIPLSCLRMPNTKYLQLITYSYRNFALFTMVFLAFRHYWTRIYHGDTDTMQVLTPPVFELKNLSKFFGASMYSFMCQHSLPSFAFYTKGNSRKRISMVLALDYIVILIFYLCVCCSAILAFGLLRDQSCIDAPDKVQCSIQGLYILNVVSVAQPILGDFLLLFPVYISITNYPMIAITTRNNLAPWFDYAKDVFSYGKSKTSPVSSEDIEELALNLFGSHSNRGQVKIWHSLAVSLPSILIACFFHNCSDIVAFTGSYAGLALGLIFPSWLLFAARRRAKSLPGLQHDVVNPYRSPFRSNFWINAVFFWAFLSLCFVIWRHVYQIFM